MSSDGGRSPRSSVGTGELFFLSGDRLMAAAVTASGPEFSSGRPSIVLQGTYLDYDVAADGRRFVVVRRPPDAPPVQVHVVLNWFEELRSRMGTAGRQ